MNSVIAIAIITFKEGLRRRVLYGVVIVSPLLMLFAVLISSFFMRDILKVLLDICLSSITIGGLLVPFFLAIDLLAGDIENRTVFTLLSRNVSRSSYISGKFLGLAMLSGTIMLTLLIATLLSVYCATLIYPAHNFTHFTIFPSLISTLMSFLGILVLTSTVVLWCSVTTSSFLTTLLTLSTYVIGHSVEDVVRFMSLKNTGVELSPLIQTTAKATLYLFPNLAAFDLKQLAAYSLPVAADEILFLCVYGLSYITIMLSLAIFFFKRRDLP